MSSIEDPDFLDNLKLQAKAVQPGILPKNTRFESYIGHTVINISDCNLEQTQIRALEKGLTFCPTPGPPDKSQIWLDFKEFHRRLKLMEFFSLSTITLEMKEEALKKLRELNVTSLKSHTKL